MRQHTAQYFGAVLVVFWNLHEWSFSVIAVTYRYGSEVSLNNTYIHLRALSRLLGTNCSRKRRFGDSVDLGQRSYSTSGSLVRGRMTVCGYSPNITVSCHTALTVQYRTHKNKHWYYQSRF